MSGATEAAASFELKVESAFVEAFSIDPETGEVRFEEAVVTGWAVAPRPIVSVMIARNGQEVAAARYGLFTPQLQAPFAAQADHSGFWAPVRDLRFPLAERSLFEVVVQTIDGERFSHPFEFRFNPEHRAGVPPPGMRVTLEAAEVTSDGLLTLSGWAVSIDDLICVQAFGEGQLLGAAQLGITRMDVAEQLPGYRNAQCSGFRFEAQLSPEQASSFASVAVQAIATGGASRVATAGLHRVPVKRTGAGAAQQRDVVFSSSDGNDILLAVEEPAIRLGRAASVAGDSLRISGWAIGRAGVESVEIEVDGQSMGATHYGAGRLDVQRAYPGWPDSLSSGYAFSIPSRLLAAGQHTVRVVARSGDQTVEGSFLCDVDPSATADGAPARIRRRMQYSEALTGGRMLAACDYAPTFEFLVCVGSSEQALRALRRTLRSLELQEYPSWTARILLPATADKALRAAAAATCKKDRRYRIERDGRESSLAPVVGKRLKSDRLFSILDAGDELGCDALLAVALANSGAHPADFLFSDEYRREPGTNQYKTFFKPGWSAELLLSTNYIGHVWFASVELVQKARMNVSELEKLGEYELILRLTEAADRVRHVPLVLCERSALHEQADEARDRASIGRALLRRGAHGDVQDGLVSGAYRVRRNLAAPGLVSIIIPSIGTKNLVKKCLESIYHKTTYSKYEVIIVDNTRSIDASAETTRLRQWFRINADTVVEADIEFNWSSLNNIGAKQARGSYLLFLNDDVEVIDGGWLETLLENAQRPEVGVVGARLLYPDRKLQHAGLFLATPGIARHAFRFAAEGEPGYFGLALTQRNVIGVTGALHMTRREVFEQLGGYDERHQVTNNDLDFCLRAREAGYEVIYTPHVELIHHEKASRGEIADVFDHDVFMSRWGKLFEVGDPYFNPNLSIHSDDYIPDPEPLQEVYGSRPLADGAKIRRILAVKLDHIGDFVTAVPALRRLHERFPQAEISVLAAPASEALRQMTPFVKNFMTFEYYNATSALGTVLRTPEDYSELRESLEALEFDLAIDLRKMPDSRKVLTYTGARYLAGFDNMNAFPWLDFALEWEGDPSGIEKRQQISFDLVNLVDAVANAFDDWTGDDWAGPTALSSDLPAPATLAELFDDEFACIHPASGNEMKQWPLEYFASLADFLIESEGVRIVILGGAGDDGLATAIVGAMRNKDQVCSLVGRCALSQLPLVISKSILFVGNDSGPGHIAGLTGTPTLTIHSGVVSSREWGVLGVDAVGVRKDTVCAPCYRQKVSDCHRNLACLRDLAPSYVERRASRLIQVGRARREAHLARSL